MFGSNCMKLGRGCDAWKRSARGSSLILPMAYHRCVSALSPHPMGSRAALWLVELSLRQLGVAGGGIVWDEAFMVGTSRLDET